LGDRVLVQGQVTEYYGLTEIGADGLIIAVEASGVPLPEAVQLTPEVLGDPDALEALEGMRVAVPGRPRVVGPTFSGCSFVLDLAEPAAPRPLRRSAADTVAPVLPVLHTTDVVCGSFPMVGTGTLVEGIAGPLTYHFETYKVVLAAGASVAVQEAPIPANAPVPPAGEAELTVATFNLENYFDDVDDPSLTAAPLLSGAELSLRQQKIAHAVAAHLGCPTLLAVQEVENRALLEMIAEQTEAACGFRYAVAHADTPDARGIDTALLVDAGRASVTHMHLAQACTSLETDTFAPEAACTDGQQPLFSRPPLVVALTVDEQPITIVVNHLKSKRGGERETEALRVAQAEQVNALATTLLQDDPEAAVLVLGDFNDYELSPTIAALTQGGSLQSLLAEVPPADRYSYVYGGVAQLIDGLFASPALAARLITATILHVNADYPAAMALDVSPAGIGHRSSDHDLPLARLAWPSPERTVMVVDAMPSLEPATSRDTPPVEETIALPPAGVPDEGQGHELTWPMVLAPLAALLALLLVRRRLATS
jgi:predicted extracellular nuclease